MARIIGTAAVRLTADEKGLALAFRRTIQNALREATAGLGETSFTDKIEQDSDKTSRNVRKIFTSMFQSVGNLGSSLLSGVLAGGKLLLLGAAAGAALAGVSALSAGLIALVGAAGQAAGAVGILPAVFAAVLAVQTTLKLGTKGVGDAFKALASGDAKQLADALEKLSPNAREFVRAAQDIKPAFDEMQLDVQERLFFGLGASLTLLGKQYLPLARTGFTQLADGLNLTAREVAAFLLTPAAFAKVADATGNITSGFDLARQAAVPLTSAVLGIVQAGSTQLPRLGEAVAGLATRFGAFIDRVSGTGQLETFFSKALDTAAQFGRILGDVGVAIGNVFSISSGAGAGLLNTLETGAQAFRDFTESASGVQALQGFFAAITTVAKQLQPIIVGVATAFGTGLAPILTSLASSIGPGILAVVQQLLPTFQALAPGVGALGEAFGRVLVAIAPILPALGQLLSSIAGGLATALNAAIGPLTTFINFLASSPGALAGVAGAAGAIGLAIGPLAPVISTVGELIGDLVTKAGGIGKVFTLATGPIGLIIGLLVALFAGSEDFRNAVIGLVSVIGGLVGQLLSALMPAFDAIIGAIGPLISQLGTALAPIITTVANLLSAVLPPVIAALVPIINSLIPIVMQAADVLGLIVAAVAPIIELLANALIPIISALLPIVTTVFNSIAEIVSAAMQIVQGVIDVVLGIITGDFDRAWSGIQNIVNGAVNLILSVVTGVFNSVVAVIKGTFDAAVSLVKSAWSAISSAVSSGVDSVINFFSNLPGNIVSALGSLGSLLASAGRDLINGLINGVKAAAAGLADAVLAPIKGAVNGVKSFLGINSPSRLFADIGRDMGRGTIVGLQDITPRLVDTATGVADQLAAAFAPTGTSSLALTSLASGGGDTGAAGQAMLGGLTLQQTNVMQPGASVQQFADQVYRDGLYALQSGGTVSAVSLGNVTSGMASPDSIFGVRGI